MSDSIFTKIIKGEIPCYKIYEDSKTFAFLDIHPKTAGHVLVVPKKQIAQVWDLAEEDYLALMETVKKVGLRIRNTLEPKFVGLQIVGVDVPHTHIHIFPFNTMEEYRRIPNMDTQPDNEALAQMTAKLAF